MLEKLFTHERFIIRHAILKYLNDRITYDDKHIANLNTAQTDIRTLAKKINVPLAKVEKYHHALHNDNEVECKAAGNMRLIKLKENGINAFVEEAWLREGRKEVNEYIYDKTKWLVPIAALLITAGSLIYSGLTIQAIREKQQLMQSELENIKHQIAPNVGASLQQGHRKY